MPILAPTYPRVVGLVIPVLIIAGLVATRV